MNQATNTMQNILKNPIFIMALATAFAVAVISLLAVIVHKQVKQENVNHALLYSAGVKDVGALVRADGLISKVNELSKTAESYQSCEFLGVYDKSTTLGELVGKAKQAEETGPKEASKAAKSNVDKLSKLLKSVDKLVDKCGKKESRSKENIIRKLVDATPVEDVTLGSIEDKLMEIKHYAQELKKEAAPSEELPETGVEKVVAEGQCDEPLQR